jgi:hypothetical protein
MSFHSLSVAAAPILLAISLVTMAPGSAAAESANTTTCASDCDVGALGQGGDSSGGRAQGFYHNGPGRIPGVDSRSAGTESSGRLELSGSVEGSLSGTFNDDTFQGRTTGIFGDCTGSGCSP